MKYSIYFYACNAATIARSLTDDPTVIERSLNKFRKAGDVPTEDVKIVEQLLADGLRGNWPCNQNLDAFLAFHWLMETVAEPILVEELIEFRHWQYWCLTGLSEVFEKYPPPFSVPTSPENLPAVYYLPNAAMEQIVSDTEYQSSSSDAQFLREEIQSIIDSVCSDGLDMILVALN